MHLLGKKRRIYLDAAAASPVNPRARRAFVRALALYGNPASPHEEGRAARAVLEAARASIAGLAEVKPDAVIVTGSATEANALGIVGHVRALCEAGRSAQDIHVLFDAGAHRSVVGAVEELAKLGVRTEPLSYKDGELDLGALRTQVTPQTALIALVLVCGETGAITPVRDIRRVVGPGVILHVDASQAPLVVPFELTRLGADLLALDAQKVGGVRGVGVLIAPRRVPLSPLYVGGGQERGLRPGTPSPAHLHAFAQALTDAAAHRDSFCMHAAELRNLLLEAVKGCAGVVVHEAKRQAPHIVNISLIGRDTDYLVALLDADGFAVSTKSACEQGGAGSRPVLQRTGQAQEAVATLRISFSPETGRDDVRAFSRALIRNMNFLDSAGILKT
jgi:cysteine desulfurase